MLNKINLSFYKTLLYSDFFFIKHNFYVAKKKKNLFLLRFKAYQVLNFVELLKNFKRFILVIKFLFVKQQNKISVNIEDTFNYNLTKAFFNVYPLYQNSEVLSITNTFKLLIARPSFDLGAPSFFYCLIGKDSKILAKNCQKIVESDTFLVSTLNLTSQVLLNGFYNISLEFNDFKKILFLILFINKIFSYYSSFSE